MMPDLITPIVVVAIVGAVTTLLSPFVATWLKRRENGRIEEKAKTLQLRGFDAVEKVLIDRSEEIVGLRARIDKIEESREQERKVWTKERADIRAALIMLKTDIEELSANLQKLLAKNPELQKILELLERMEIHIQQGLEREG
jgi:hypothetical protein